MTETHTHEPGVDLPPTRRNFYILFINGAMGLIGLALAIPAAARAGWEMLRRARPRRSAPACPSRE